jgi:hypothetical protein
MEDFLREVPPLARAFGLCVRGIVGFRCIIPYLTMVYEGGLKMWVEGTPSARFCYQFNRPTVHLGDEAQLVDLFGFPNTPPQTTA